MTWTHKLRAQLVLINRKIRCDTACHFSKIVEALSSIGFVTVNSMFANFTVCSRNVAFATYAKVKRAVALEFSGCSYPSSVSRPKEGKKSVCLGNTK